MLAYFKQRGLDVAAGRPRTVDGTGCRRRLQALQALGWSCGEIGAELGVGRATVHGWLHQDRFYVETAERVRVVYDRLSMRLPPATSAPQQRMRTYVKNRARRHGWAPPLAWDDETIDDPATEPASGTDEKAPGNSWLDEAVVQRLLESGERVRTLTHAEAAMAYRRLRRMGLSTKQIEDCYGLKSDRYEEDLTA